MIRKRGRGKGCDFLKIKHENCIKCAVVIALYYRIGIIMYYCCYNNNNNNIRRARVNSIANTRGVEFEVIQSDLQTFKRPHAECFVISGCFTRVLQQQFCLPPCNF